MENYNHNLEKKRNFIIEVAYICVIFALIFCGFRFAMPLLGPFVIAICIAAVLNPLARIIAKRMKIKKSIIAAIIVFLAFSTIGLVLTLLIIKGITLVEELVAGLPNYYKETIEPMLNETINKIGSSLSRIDPSYEQIFNDFQDNLTASLSNTVINASGSVLNKLLSFASSLPTVLINVMLGIIATFFIAMDYETVIISALNVFPRNARSIILKSKTYLVKIIGKYLVSYGLIMLITFSELSIGFLIIGIDSPVLVAFVIALFDIMPVVGTGTVMIPWIIIKLIQGDITMFIGLLIIYAIVTVIRNIVEPKLIGKQVGIHPVLTLVCMFVGTVLFGVIGLFGLPISAALLKNLYEEGLISIFGRRKRDFTPETIETADVIHTTEDIAKKNDDI